MPAPAAYRLIVSLDASTLERGRRLAPPGLGTLLRRYRLEAYRELLGHDEDGTCRRYLIYIQGIPALLIGETFSWYRLRFRAASLTADSRRS